jgi:hypothetical protein
MVLFTLVTIIFVSICALLPRDLQLTPVCLGPFVPHRHNLQSQNSRISGYLTPKLRHRTHVCNLYSSYSSNVLTRHLHHTSLDCQSHHET